jgi:hypothetical protein
MSATDPFREVCGHVQAAGSAVAGALQACDRLPAEVLEDAGTSRHLAAIRRCLLETGSLLDRAEHLAYPLPRPDEADGAGG